MGATQKEKVNKLVYSNSTEVLIWLGMPKVDSGLAIYTTQELESFSRRVDANNESRCH